MTRINSNAFVLPHTFFRERAERVIPELINYGFSGLNLALNYHSSRDLFLRQSPILEYSPGGFHYYRADSEMYGTGAIKPSPRDQLPTNQMLDSVISAAKQNNFEVNAWAVYLNNSAIGSSHPEVTVTNVFGNSFLSQLCPANPAVSEYAIGLTKDLCSRGVNGIRAESLHFHGARHGEQHHRFFIELSAVSEFLFSICFCIYCQKNYESKNLGIEQLMIKIRLLLVKVFEEKDPWIGKILDKQLLAEIVGPEIIGYLSVREQVVTNLYKQIVGITKKAGATFNFVDQAPLLDMNSSNATFNSWQVGIDNAQIQEVIDRYEPLIYRSEIDQVSALAIHYLSQIGTDFTAILRPTYPDCTGYENLSSKINALIDLNVRDIDFYLLDTMRKSDLNNIKLVLR